MQFRLVGRLLLEEVHIILWLLSWSKTYEVYDVRRIFPRFSADVSIVVLIFKQKNAYVGVPFMWFTSANNEHDPAGESQYTPFWRL